MKIPLQNDSIFHCPEGHWPAVCEAIEEPIKRINRPCEKQVRLRFRATTDQGDKLVSRTFCADLSFGSELRNHLENWCGDDLERYTDDYGEIDLGQLAGKKADLAVMHGPSMSGHTHPFANLAGIYPRGYLTEE